MSLITKQLALDLQVPASRLPAVGRVMLVTLSFAKDDYGCAQRSQRSQLP